MESEVLKVALSQGIWAALSVALIFYILKAQEVRDSKQDEREAKYQNIISKLTDDLADLDDVKKNIQDIKEHISGK